MKNNHKLTIAALLVLTALLLTLPSALLAQNISLAWDPSDSDGVVGYKIYYKANSTELPLDGIEALEGPSPIDVGDVTSFTLTELPEGSVYYFRATAYDSSGYESTLSNLAASAWIPAPLSPEMGERAGAPATLVWSAPPEDLDLTFTLIYGTDPQLRSSATIAAGNNHSDRPSMPGSAPLLAALLCLAGLTLRQLAARFGKKRLLAATVCLGLALSTASCGGGGGGGGGGTPSASLSSESDTLVVAGLTDNYYTTGDLEAGATYYWQVVAVDGDGQEYESEVSSFVAE